MQESKQEQKGWQCKNLSCQHLHPASMGVVLDICLKCQTPRGGVIWKCESKRCGFVNKDNHSSTCCLCRCVSKSIIHLLPNSGPNISTSDFPLSAAYQQTAKNAGSRSGYKSSNFTFEGVGESSSSSSSSVGNECKMFDNGDWTPIPSEHVTAWRSLCKMGEKEGSSSVNNMKSQPIMNTVFLPISDSIDDWRNKDDELAKKIPNYFWKLSSGDMPPPPELDGNTVAQKERLERMIANDIRRKNEVLMVVANDPKPLWLFQLMPPWEK